MMSHTPLRYPAYSVDIDELRCKGIVPKRKANLIEPKVRKSATVHKLNAIPEFQRIPISNKRVYRDCVGELCERTVSLALDVPLARLQSKTRLNADVALARQVAMYLCNTIFSIPYTEVGLHFQRDRTTVTHACKLVEDKRDDMAFDVMVCQLEALLTAARDAGVCYFPENWDELLA